MDPTGVCPGDKNCSNKTDEDLALMIQGNKQCFVCLTDRYEDKLLRYIRRISGVPQEGAEDILQDIFLKVYKNLNSFDPKLKFSSWIYRIAHNETINHWRRNKRRKEANVSWDANEPLQNVLSDGSDAEDNVYQKFTNQQLIEAVEKLSEKYRSVLVLNYLEGRSYQEIADILNKPIGTVGTLLNRAKKNLKKVLLKSGVDSAVATRNL